MGRPKLSETALRRHALTVRLNDGEHEEFAPSSGEGAAAGARVHPPSGCWSGGFRSAARGNSVWPSFGS